MITYSKDYWGYGSVTRLYGSAIPRSLPAAVLSTAIALLFEFFGEQGTMNEWFSRFDDEISGPARNPTPYPFQVFAFVVGFMLVFRYGGWQRTCIDLSDVLEVEDDRTNAYAGLALLHTCSSTVPLLFGTCWFPCFVVSLLCKALPTYNEKV